MKRRKVIDNGGNMLYSDNMGNGRRVVLIEEEEWRQLKATLALRGVSVSEWFRQKAKEEVNRNGDDEKGGSGEIQASGLHAPERRADR